MADLIQIPVIVLDMRPRQDKSWRISFETRELSGAEVSLLASNLQGEGWLVYKPNEIKVDEIPDDPAESGTKSQSQRLRDVIYVLYKQKGKGDFETFYRLYLEKLIDFTKDKLEPEEA